MPQRQPRSGRVARRAGDRVDVAEPGHRRRHLAAPGRDRPRNLTSRLQLWCGRQVASPAAQRHGRGRSRCAGTVRRTATGTATLSGRRHIATDASERDDGLTSTDNTGADGGGHRARTWRSRGRGRGAVSAREGARQGRVNARGRHSDPGVCRPVTAIHAGPVDAAPRVSSLAQDEVPGQRFAAPRSPHTRWSRMYCNRYCNAAAGEAAGWACQFVAAACHGGAAPQRRVGTRRFRIRCGVLPLPGRRPCRHLQCRLRGSPVLRSRRAGRRTEQPMTRGAWARRRSVCRRGPCRGSAGVPAQAGLIDWQFRSSWPTTGWRTRFCRLW